MNNEKGIKKQHKRTFCLEIQWKDPGENHMGAIILNWMLHKRCGKQSTADKICHILLRVP
jgi:hypothetical protein